MQVKEEAIEMTAQMVNEGEARITRRNAVLIFLGGAVAGSGAGIAASLLFV